MTQSRQRDSIDFSQQALTEFPQVYKPAVVVRMEVSGNLLKSLPDMSSYVCLRYLDLSYNKFTDLSALADAVALRELDISHNRVQSVDFVQHLPHLEVFRASYNNISNITVDMSPTLTELDLSHNEISSLEFLQDRVPPGIEYIDVSSNAFDDITNLRYIAVFHQLRVLKTGLLQSNSDINLIQFVKHICPALEKFDDEECPEEDDVLFNDDKLLEILVNGSEKELKDFLSGADEKIVWDEADFIEFDDENTSTPLNDMEERLKSLEDKINSLETTPKEVNEQSQYPAETESTIQEIRRSIQDIQQQMIQVTQLLYAHDRALGTLWRSNFDNPPN